MPPKKRASKESTGAEPASKSRRQDNGEGPSTRSEPEHANESGSNDENGESGQNDDEDPFQYICMIQPPWARDGQEDDEEQAVGKKVHAKPSTEHPEWEWVVMRQTWLIMTEWHRRTDYCQPDNFDMYIYNDFFGYGLQELQENLLVRFNEEFSKKQKSVEAMWAVMAGMMHWRLLEIDNWLSHDDGEREGETWGLTGCAFLTMLNELDRTGSLKPDSKFEDLALVMVMALKMSEGQEDHDEELLKWRNTIVAYARKGGIDLETAPLHDAHELVDDVDENQASEDLGQAKADRWGWRKQYKEFVANNGTQKRANGKPTLGGTEYDITKMSSEERAEHNFDKVDPLPKNPPKGAVLEFRR